METLSLPMQIIGFTEAFKWAGLDQNFLPFMAIILGILLTMGEKGFTLQNGIAGAITGLLTTMTFKAIDDRVPKIHIIGNPEVIPTDSDITSTPSSIVDPSQKV